MSWECAVDYNPSYERTRLQKKRKVAGLLLDDINPLLENQPSLVDCVLMQDIDKQLEATAQLRILLSTGDTPPVKEVFKSGLVPCLIEFLKQENAPRLQFEAAWALTNIAAGDDMHRKVIIYHRALPVFVALLNSPFDHVLEQAIWFLRNMASYSYECKNYVLNCGFMELLLAQLNTPANPSILRIATWTLANCCFKHFHSDFDEMKPSLAVLVRLLHLNDEEVLIDACRAFCQLCHPSFYIHNTKYVIDAGVCARLVELLSHRLSLVLSLALETIGYIARFSDEMQIQYIVNLNVLPLLSDLLRENKERPNIGILACSAIHNIIVKRQIQAAINANIMDPLLDFLRCAKPVCKYEALHPLVYTITCGTNKQIEYLLSKGCIKALCDVLECGYGHCTLRMCLEGLTNILEMGKAETNTEEVNIYAEEIKDAGGLQKLEKLKYEYKYETPNGCDIKIKAAHMLMKYFGVDRMYRDFPFDFFSPQLLQPI